MRSETRAVPVIEKVLLPDSTKVLDIESSGSVRGGMVAARSRCKRKTSESFVAAAPAPASSSDGSWSDVRYIDENLPGERTTNRIQLNVEKTGESKRKDINQRTGTAASMRRVMAVSMSKSSRRISEMVMVWVLPP